MQLRNTWQLQLSFEKCCIFEINKKHSTSSTSFFCLNGVSLPATNIVIDLGITVNDSLTPCTHIAKMTATAHQRVNLIVRTVVSRRVIYLCYCVHILRMLDPYLNITLLSCPLRLNMVLLLLRKFKGGLQSAYLDSEISVMPKAEVNST